MTQQEVAIAWKSPMLMTFTNSTEIPHSIRSNGEILASSGRETMKAWYVFVLVVLNSDHKDLLITIQMD